MIVNMIFEDEQEKPSKSQVKRDMHALQELGENLIKLTKPQLEKIPIPAELRTAIDEARRIKSRSALRRQKQYIGRLMREIDSEPIRKAYEALQLGASRANLLFHQLEKWRDRLIEEGDEAVELFIQDYPHTDRNRLRQLVRNCNKERKTETMPKTSRALFRYLREVAEQNNPEE
jgi:ribosome-associated protein